MKKYKSVYDLRTSLGITQEEFARIAGLKRGTISEIENGKKPSTSTLDKIAKAFNCELEINFVKKK
jgi:transcriptional regulator with XRE-family HTH domain